ncbi:MAG: dihydropteroate synthase [Clostridiales bacterium]|nr:dihydropteroate synthase [Clostridiales bacterium]
MIISCRGRSLDTSNGTLLMGILNVTPDSFSDGGRNFRTSDALFAAEKMVRDGADVIDVGGESTRPGYTEISVDEELSRIIPVIKGITENLDVTVSVDTYKSEVAQGALDAGCHIINDIYGLQYDPNMASVVANNEAAAVLMFNCRRNGECLRENIIDRALRELSGSVDRAVAAGIPEDALILDPGIGFGTSRSQDIELIASLDRLSFGGRFPVLLACSRKRVAADIAGRDTMPEERDDISIGLGLAGVSKGASMLRVHNVRAAKDVLLGYETALGI